MSVTQALDSLSARAVDAILLSFAIAVNLTQHRNEVALWRELTLADVLFAIARSSATVPVSKALTEDYALALDADRVFVALGVEGAAHGSIDPFGKRRLQAITALELRTKASARARAGDQEGAQTPP